MACSVSLNPYCNDMIRAENIFRSMALSIIKGVNNFEDVKHELKKYVDRLKDLEAIKGDVWYPEDVSELDGFVRFFGDNFKKGIVCEIENLLLFCRDFKCCRKDFENNLNDFKNKLL